jgi:hypothetical protein
MYKSYKDIVPVIIPTSTPWTYKHQEVTQLTPDTPGSNTVGQVDADRLSEVNNVIPAVTTVTV